MLVNRKLVLLKTLTVTPIPYKLWPLVTRIYRPLIGLIFLVFTISTCWELNVLSTTFWDFTELSTKSARKVIVLTETRLSRQTDGLDFFFVESYFRCYITYRKRKKVGLKFCSVFCSNTWSNYTRAQVKFAKNPRKTSKMQNTRKQKDKLTQTILWKIHVLGVIKRREDPNR